MQIIVTLTPDSGGDPLAALASPPPGADLVELRLDLFPELDPSAAVAACPLPIVTTLRSRAEGGRGSDDPTARAGTLERARDAGTALLDLELARDLPLLNRLGLDPERVIVSWHDTEGTPDDLDQVCERLAATPARWLKAVPTARSLADLVRVLALHRRFNRGRSHARRLLLFAMGSQGQASRYFAPLLGPPLAFAAWDPRRPAAPGQPGAGRLRAAIGHLGGPPQQLFGVVGADVTRSLSPALHGAGFARLGLPYALLPFSVPDAAELPRLFAPRGATVLDELGLPLRGLAVTTPHKGAAAAAATVAAPRVRRAGSANTLLLRPNQVMADNTDADGVVAALLATGLELPDVRVLVQGTGGAARGVAVGLDLAGAEVRLRGRDADNTRGIAAALELGWLPPGAVVEDSTVLVNATPLGGGREDPSPFTAAEVAAAEVVVDMVYADHRPALAELAAEAGTVYVDGREVLLHQGFAQFAAFTGRMPPKEAMRSALTE